MGKSDPFGIDSPFRIPLGSRWLLTPWSFVGFLLVGLLVNYLVLFALSSSASNIFSRSCSTLLPWLLRLAGFTMMTWYFFFERRRTVQPRWRCIFFFLLGALWWVPWPMTPLLAMSTYFLTDRSKHQESLARAAFSGHGSAAAWQRLIAHREGTAVGESRPKRLFSRLPSRQRMPELGETELQIRHLCWLKASVLLPEAGILGAILTRSAASPTEGERMASKIFLTTAQRTALSLGILTALATAVLFLASAVGSKKAQGSRRAPPYLAYLAWTQMFLWCGLVTGEAFAEGDSAKAGAMLALLGLGGIFVQTFPTFLSLLLPVPQPPATSEIRRLVAVVLFGGLFSYGLLLMQVRPSRLSPGNLAVALILISLLSSTRLLDPLFSPFPPSRIRDTRLTPRERAAFLVMLVTAIIPLGGLAIPGWFYLRARWWPGLKRRLLPSSGPSDLSPEDELVGN